jgi:hypothetical protein
MRLSLEARFLLHGKQPSSVLSYSQSMIHGLDNVNSFAAVYGISTVCCCRFSFTRRRRALMGSSGKKDWLLAGRRRFGRRCFCRRRRLGRSFLGERRLRGRSVAEPVHLCVAPALACQNFGSGSSFSKFRLRLQR